MHLILLFLFNFCQTTHSFLEIPYPHQAFELPNHPSNWTCTVHVTVATFANHRSLEVTERFLISNHGKIITTLSTMLNRSIGIDPVISFFEPCTISALIDATISGSSYVFSQHGIARYIDVNKYIYRGWRHSIIILIHFTCFSARYAKSFYLPHRLFDHSPDCGPPNTFPNQVFVPDSRRTLRAIKDPTYNIHYRQLPLVIRNSISKPVYTWDERWKELSQMESCTVGQFAFHQYQEFLNFTVIATVRNGAIDYGALTTRSKYHDLRFSVSMCAIDSRNDRVIYCDQDSDSPTLRPIKISSPFNIETWIIIAVFLMLCGAASTFAIFDLSLVRNESSTVRFIKSMCASLLELISCFLEKDVGKRNFTKTLIGLILICLGNDYKNYLTIELVYPRAVDPIQNVTELLDLKFSIIQFIPDHIKIQHKSIWLKDTRLYIEIDEGKREHYVLEADRWLLHSSASAFEVMEELASGTVKNAWFVSAPYYIQVSLLSAINERNFSLSCHFC
jgi:hypothetical protein